MAANSIDQSPFFQGKRSRAEIVVKDPPKFDLESYVSNYDGRTRIHRLHHIGSCSPFLALEAYRTAITEAKKGKNIKLYLSLVEDFAKISPSDPLAVTDSAWVDKKKRDVKEEQDKLEHELKAYKNNLIKESIRMGHEDLGHFFYATGNFADAQKAYMRMREHCTSSKHIADMGLRVTLATIAQQSWLQVHSGLVKIDASQLKGEDKAKLEPIVSAVTGLAHMALGSFRDAATSFIHTSPAYLNVEPAAGIAWQREALSGNDVAVYGGLCALASMDRVELQQMVLSNTDFRNFLELEPHIRRAITLFCNSKYSACLEVLESYRNDYLLDVYLSSRVSEIYNNIRTKSIVQYFIPFSCVTLDEMADKFQPTGDYASIETELEDMINAGVLDARIDLVDRLLICPSTDPRFEVHSNALEMAESYDQTLRLRLSRINMLSAGFAVPAEKGSKMDAFMGGGMGDGGVLRNLGSKLGLS
ncbi:PCI-domain-containing protein [Aaosphaeria arxii CBS 175.79]|uniref:COP9 signalosome complex subunit 1 n=1 Tax=Aaosphaeria arxii CBS 175.79 TaxID=1450172 RepID=A0A6A5Y9M7_9PLEO|nr:PCI-domain-containing protein [Aaosphaeria arxii CBS 175.79]KAF2022118.1 PCI-domain-containing protein [Aaosphaeria arxii CBS 175.79]